MIFAVWLTRDANRDLAELYGFITENDSPDQADHVTRRIEQAFERLAEFPERGAYPKELLELGVREYREIFFKPYRIIYRILGNDVYVLLIADGRRDMRSLLQRRLLDA